MDLYTLKFAADGTGEAKNVLIEALNDTQALAIAGEMAGGRPARLFVGSKELCCVNSRHLLASEER